MFVNGDLTPLMRGPFMDVVREWLTGSGVPHADDYHGHSFRRGGAQSLADRGCTSEQIQEGGRWKSSAHKVYHNTNYSLSMCDQFSKPAVRK